ncbi:MAG: hypothetical protein JSU65_01135 [Candidatus Zixiibacteriota bacterium]|nr:MAG: hypothetical protein JSU65_01135 [candidate division Zixibacteria bacterium]
MTTTRPLMLLSAVRLTRLCGGILLALMLLAGSSIKSQDCGTIVPRAQIDYELLLRASGIDFTARRAPSTAYEIPVAVHIVRQSDGTDGFAPSELAIAMADINAQYAQVGWTFFVAGDIDYIDSDYYYYNTTTFSVYGQLVVENRVPWAMNVYFCPNTSWCGVSSFSSTPERGLLVDSACAGHAGNNSTFAHEVGHWFDLFHTHETAFGVECPNGANCSYAGDLFCDTPADPTLSGHVDPSTCSYDNAVPPPDACDGTPYAPQTENLMSYSTKLCRDLFTTEQSNKMVYTLENQRTQLSVFIGGLGVIPGNIAPLPVELGSTATAQVTIHQSVADQQTLITGVSTSLSELSVIGTLPTTLIDVDSVQYTVEFDATGLSSDCDLGVKYDTVRFTTNSAERPLIEVPVEVAISYVETSMYNHLMGSHCLRFTAPNTAGFGNQQPAAFSLEYMDNALYDGSLLLGLIDGNDTVVYRDVFGAQDYAVIDTFITYAGGDQRGVNELRFSTADGRIHGKVFYTQQVTDPVECQYALVEYEFYNSCDTTLSILAGMYADFDVVDATQNRAGYDSTTGTVWISQPFVYQSQLETAVQVCGISMLSDSPRNLRALSNSEFVYPTNNLVEGQMYEQMSLTGNTSSSVSQDWSALLTLGDATIGPGDTARFTAALMYSDNGTNELADIRSRAEAYYDNLDCCVASVGNVNNDPADIVDIGDLTQLITYLFITFEPPDCMEEANINGSSDGVVDMGDLTDLISYLFIPPPDPLPDCP